MRRIVRAGIDHDSVALADEKRIRAVECEGAGILGCDPTNARSDRHHFTVTRLVVAIDVDGHPASGLRGEGRLSIGNDTGLEGGWSMSAAVLKQP
jgi:hypothetical protein